MFPPNTSSRFAALLLVATAGVASGASIDEIVVVSDFRQSPEMDYPASVSVVSDARIRARAAQVLDEVLNVAPNVNFTAGASRGRYLQIRGIGERSQFVDPINPSVGLTIDGVNLSGAGNAGTLFDVQQVEVLRGPQGTRYGANALAGMVNIVSNPPTETFEGLLSLGAGNYDTRDTGVVLSGPLNDHLLGRIAVEQYRSDGFIKNRFLDREDTNRRDELTARGKLRWQVDENLTLNTTLFYVDVDNGYDAFSLDNSRNTLSDKPGQDNQETVALAVNASWRSARKFVVESTLAAEHIHVEYGYDEDWTNTAICDGLDCDSGLWGFDWWYSSTDNYQRKRDSLQLDLRLVSTADGRLLDRVDWVTGLYVIDQGEDLRRDFFDWDLTFSTAQFNSDYDTRRAAWYGELSLPFADRFTASIGARVENFNADYSDDRGVQTKPDDTLWGGHITLEYRTSDFTLLYAKLSRGYKAGGVNGEALGKAQLSNFDPSVIEFLNDRLVFDTETADNLELGLKGSYLDGSWRLRIAAFYMQRSDMQLRGWYNQGQDWVGYIDNSASGKNLGLEVESDLSISDNIGFFASLGMLNTEIEDFYILSDDMLVDKSGRDQAQAPHYQYNLGMRVSITDRLALRCELDGRDRFYFSDSHDQRSKAYNLVNAALSYSIQDMDFRLWGRNLTNKDYAVRGFYFANDPREFYANDHAYVQLGDPRTWGVSATYHF